jgi:hypothetical protein
MGRIGIGLEGWHLLGAASKRSHSCDYDYRCKYNEKV